MKIIWVLLVFQGPAPIFSETGTGVLEDSVVVAPMDDWGQCESIKRSLPSGVGAWCVQADPD
jgi:hypothetical protein